MAQRATSPGLSAYLCIHVVTAGSAQTVGLLVILAQVSTTVRASRLPNILPTELTYREGSSEVHSFSAMRQIMGYSETSQRSNGAEEGASCTRTMP